MTPRETLAEFFFGLLDDPGEDGSWARPQPAVFAAALAYLRALYVEGGRPTEPWETTTAFMQVLRLILGDAGAEGTRGLIAIALETPDPRLLRRLADLVLGVVPPDDLARAMIAAVVSGGAGRRAHVGELSYYTFDAAGEDYEASEALAAELARVLAGSHV